MESLDHESTTREKCEQTELQFWLKTMAHNVKIYHATHIGCPPHPLFNVSVKNIGNSLRT